jgi:glycerol-1-phosphate dehydrogenase [NAD(P)+]
MATLDVARIGDWHVDLAPHLAPGESLTPVPIKQVYLTDDGPDRLARAVAAGASVLLVAGETPMSRGGEDLETQVMAALSRRARLKVHRLRSGRDGELHADLAGARALAPHLAGHDAVVSLGSGTVTDLVKYARHLGAPKTRFLSYATAASVTAFSSALAVLLVDGVKRTLPARPPDIIVADLPTLCAAPSALTRAGFGDVLARSVSHADWWLASELGLDETFTHLPARLMADFEQDMIDRAEAVAAGESDGVGAVFAALLAAGAAMSLVGQTAPLSGWEHVISHWLDMTAAHHERRCALHGEQVGVATLVAARAYALAWRELDTVPFCPPWTPADQTAYRAKVERVFGAIDPSGAMTAQVWRDAERKLAFWAAGEAPRLRFVARLRAGELDEPLRAAVRTPADIAGALARAGAPRSFATMTQPVSEVQAEDAVRHAHLVRHRFTLGDLLSFAGWLDDNALRLLCPTEDEP